MAHLHFKRTVFKAGGRAAAGKVAYITRQPGHELSRAEQQLRYIGHDEGRGRQREDLIYTNSKNLPAWAQGSAHTFFQATEQYERSRRRRVFRMEITLPRN